MTAPSAPQAGNVLGGRYLLLDRLGSGGPTSVWRARDRETQELVALRLLRPDLARDAVQRERFFRGAHVTAELDHAAVVPVLVPEAREGDECYFVMKLVQGTDLRRALIDGRLSPDEALARLLTVGDALATAHFRGIVHLDVKPANVLLDAAMAPWLTDFDLVSVPPGTDPRADVLGLGRTAIFALLGRDADATPALVEALRCGPAIKAVLKRAIAAEPEACHRDAATFCEALREALAVDGGAGPAGMNDDGDVSVEVSADEAEAIEEESAPEVAVPPEEVIAACRAALEIDALEIAPYRRIYKAQLERKAHDEAWCAASVLAFAGEASPEETQFFDDYLLDGVPRVKGRLDNEAWIRHLFHPDESLYVGKIFEMIAPAALRAKIESLKARKEVPVLPKRFLQDPATSTVTLAKVFGWAAQVLGLPTPPRLYLRSDVPGALVAAASEPPATVAGATMLDLPMSEMLFVVGKHLATYRGEHYISNLFPTVTELTVLLFAGIRLVAPQAPGPHDLDRQILATAEALRSFIQPIQLEGLRMVVKKLLTDRGERHDVKRWAQAAELTGCRAGLLLSGDLRVAARILAAEPQHPWLPTAREKVEELMRWSVSEGYAELRRQLGICIRTGGE